MLSRTNPAAPPNPRTGTLSKSRTSSIKKDKNGEGGEKDKNGEGGGGGVTTKPTDIKQQLLSTEIKQQKSTKLTSTNTTLKSTNPPPSSATHKRRTARGTGGLVGASLSGHVSGPPLSTRHSGPTSGTHAASTSGTHAGPTSGPSRKEIIQQFTHLIESKNTSDTELRACLKKLRLLVLKHGIPHVQTRHGSLKSCVWKILLGVYRIDSVEYISLIQKGINLF